jgi:hypothetical protein
MARRADLPLKCPSAEPGMTDLQVLGVISRDGEKPMLAYLDEPVGPAAEMLALAEPLPVSHVFRLAGRCEEKKCAHFDGARCQLAVRIVDMLPEVVDSLPACTIRPECRWFRQEGKAACLRCPQVVTGTYEADEVLQKVCGVPPRSA